MHACDGQTGRILIARPRLHCMQRGKNSTELINVNKKSRVSALVFHVFSEYYRVQVGLP